MALIENLWYGNIDPHETILTERRRYKHLLSLMAKKLMAKNRDEPNETLTEKQSETLEKYDEAVNEIHSLAEVETFSYGYRFAIRPMIEANGNNIVS